MTWRVSAVAIVIWLLINHTQFMRSVVGPFSCQFSASSFLARSFGSRTPDCQRRTREKQDTRKLLYIRGAGNPRHAATPRGRQPCRCRRCCARRGDDGVRLAWRAAGATCECLGRPYPARMHLPASPSKTTLPPHQLQSSGTGGGVCGPRADVHHKRPSTQTRKLPHTCRHHCRRLPRSLPQPPLAPAPTCASTMRARRRRLIKSTTAGSAATPRPGVSAPPRRTAAAALSSWNPGSGAGAPLGGVTGHSGGPSCQAQRRALRTPRVRRTSPGLVGGPLGPAGLKPSTLRVGTPPRVFLHPPSRPKTTAAASAPPRRASTSQCSTSTCAPRTGRVRGAYGRQLHISMPLHAAQKTTAEARGWAAASRVPEAVSGARARA
jgi:hypothetical protein